MHLCANENLSLLLTPKKDTFQILSLTIQRCVDVIIALYKLRMKWLFELRNVIIPIYYLASNNYC